MLWMTGIAHVLCFSKLGWCNILQFWNEMNIILKLTIIQIMAYIWWRKDEAMYGKSVICSCVMKNHMALEGLVVQVCIHLYSKDDMFALVASSTRICSYIIVLLITLFKIHFFRYRCWLRLQFFMVTMPPCAKVLKDV